MEDRFAQRLRRLHLAYSTALVRSARPQARARAAEAALATRAAATARRGAQRIHALVARLVEEGHAVSWHESEGDDDWEAVAPPPVPVLLLSSLPPPPRPCPRAAAGAELQRCGAQRWASAAPTARRYEAHEVTLERYLWHAHRYEPF